MTIYIPCYFNNIKERSDNFYKNINNNLKLKYKIVIYWMNDEPFKLKNNNIKIIKGNIVNASKARNILLNIFYNTDDNYCLISDDDTFINSLIYENLDCVSFVNDYYKKITETYKISSSLLLLKNFKKFYNKKPYFDETLDANQDLDFGLNLNSLNIKTYRKSSNEVTIYKGKSSMFKNNMNKIIRKQKSLEVILKKYKNGN